MENRESKVFGIRIVINTGENQ